MPYVLLDDLIIFSNFNKSFHQRPRMGLRLVAIVNQTRCYGNKLFHYDDLTLVRAVRAINGLFGANCSKATKFGPDVDKTLLDRFWVDAKKGSPCATVGAKSKMATTRYQKYQN